MNNLEDAKFKSVQVAVKYFNESGAEIEEYVHKYGDLDKEPKVPVAFKIKRNVEAARFQCLLKSADVRDLNPPKKIDSLNKIITKLDEKIKEIEEN